MTDLNCLLAGLVRLLSPILLLWLLRKKVHARIYPALIAFIVCFPVFIVAGFIRSGFSHSSHAAFCIQQGLLYGIFEEGGKFLTMRYLLSSYDRPTDSITYGIGHGMFEEIGAGFACLNLIGTGNASSYILPANILFTADGAVSVVALTVIIFYGIQTNKSGKMLTLAILLHFVGNATTGLFGNTLLMLLLTIIEGCIAYRCWQAMRPPLSNNIQ
ncbi:MAG: YhfC family intramembrane metalloprotease [Ruminococcus sp.]|uniref:YhfC family glutamic-type intramembrane protease n=1 Tax=Ruminococcus sp. TaxID=41978 RepID=UPI0025EA041D|nr:YhfC family glutamic-type intramembrane protease [Ruminococcus sp.]MCR5599203.1 YhfC family intramembrane metalloprotease [Ruminococcus sp.]